MLDLLRRPDWHAHAACTGKSDLMYSTEPRDINRALALCHTCPVRQRCLADALQRQEPTGIWGGFTDTERKTITAALRHGEKMFQVVSRVRSSRQRR